MAMLHRSAMMHKRLRQPSEGLRSAPSHRAHLSVRRGTKLQDAGRDESTSADGFRSGDADSQQLSR